MARTLGLRRTALAELTGDELAGVGGGLQTQDCLTPVQNSFVWCLTGHYTGVADR